MSHSYQYYARFFCRDLNGTDNEALGSDSIHYLDGRNTIGNMERDAKFIMEMRNANLIKEYTGFEIRRGDFNNYSVIKKVDLS